MGYRPITDFWILARPKVKYYGAYPSGFLERARALLGVTINDPVLHVCGGKVRDYPYPRRAVGPRDGTVDIDPDTNPDWVLDVRDLGSDPKSVQPDPNVLGGVVSAHRDRPDNQWAGILIDRPYTQADHEHYQAPEDAFPDNLNALLKNCLSLVKPGGRVGVLDYLCPRPPRVGVKYVAAVAVLCGFGNRIRVYSVFEREAARPDLDAPTVNEAPTVDVEDDPF